MKNGQTYNDFLWGEYSFSWLLENKLIWDINKYWELELFLIDLIKDDFSHLTVNKQLSADLYFLGRFIDKCVYCTINPLDAWSIENLNEEDLCFYHERFDHLMRVLWGRIEFIPNDYFFYENPLYLK